MSIKAQGVGVLNILVVEGHKLDDWNKLTDYLRRRQFSLHTAFSVREAYKILRNEQINLVISEYSFPKVNSINFLKKMKYINPQIEIIFLSEKATLSKAIEAMKEGAYDFYEFPVNAKLLMAVIQKAIEKQNLYFEKKELERKVKEKFNLGKIVGRSKAMQHVIEIAGSVAQKNVNILLTGETGTGKEMIANAIHYNSQRSSKPFIKVNCAVFNEGVLESELFGHEKGAFTGAITKRIGRFEIADGGTIFLDEIGDLPHSTQIKLLRILQEREFERVGGNETIKADVRVIAATHQNLKELMEEGKFREDLYYRLNVVHIELPSLIERKDDIPLLVSTFINKLNQEKDYQINGIAKEAMQLLMNYQWPGNVRELENAVESAMALSERDIIEAKYLPAFLLLAQPQNGTFFRIPQNLTLDGMEKEIIKLTLQKTSGNKTQAAKLLGIGLRTLQRKTKEL